MQRVICSTICFLWTLGQVFAFDASAPVRCNSDEIDRLTLAKEELKNRREPKFDLWETTGNHESYDTVHGQISVEDGEQNLEVDFEVYLSKTNGETSAGDGHLSKFLAASAGKRSTPKRPVIFLMPGIIGSTPLEYLIGRRYARAGYHVVISHFRDSEADRDPFRIRENTMANIRASLATIDAFSGLDFINEDKMGLIGYSFGGIRASFIQAIDERIKAYSFVVSSGSFSETLAYSTLKGIVKVRDEQMRRLGIDSISEYIEHVKTSLPFEPVDTLCDKTYSNAIHYVSDQDTVVPSHLQRQYQEAMSDSRLEVFQKLGHVPSVLWFAFKKLDENLAFFEKQWSSSKSLQ